MASTRSGTCSIPARGALLNLLRQYPHPLALSEGYFATWRRWARESRPEHVAEIDALASTGVQTVVPLRTKDDLVGVLLLGPPTGRERYTAAERQVLSNSGEVFALMLENARLTDRAVEQEKVRRDLAMAAEVQRRLLPRHAPRNAAATFAAYTLPARTIGGDYYDFLDLGGEAGRDRGGRRLGQGHLRCARHVRGAGFAAGDLVAAELVPVSACRADERIPVPVHRRQQIRDVLLRAGRGARPAASLRQCWPQSALLGALGEWRHGDHRAQVGGTVLGLFPEIEFQEAEIDLRAGDLLVAFTDGVTDALDGAGEEFGEERLKEVLRAAVGASAGEVSERLAGTMRDWIGNAEQHDDMTFVVVAVKTGQGATGSN